MSVLKKSRGKKNCVTNTNTLAEYCDIKGTRWRLVRIERGPIELENRDHEVGEWTWITDVCEDPESLWPDAECALTRIVRNINGKRAGKR